MKTFIYLVIETKDRMKEIANLEEEKGSSAQGTVELVPTASGGLSVHTLVRVLTNQRPLEASVC